MILKTHSVSLALNAELKHIETVIANLQNLENKIKPIKTKRKTMEMYQGIREMFRSADLFRSIFKFLNTEPHCENEKF